MNRRRNVGKSEVPKEPEGRHSSDSKKNPLVITLIIISAIVALATNFGAPRNRSGTVMQALVYNTVSSEQLEQLLKDSDESGSRLSPEFLESSQLRHYSVLHGQVWRLITPIFIHFGAFHIVFNMIWLYQLGRMIEHRYGTVYLGGLVLFIALASNFAQCAVPEGIGGSVPGPAGGGYLSTMFGGMSGVVFGLLGFIWIKSSTDPDSRIAVSPVVITIMLVYMFFCMTPMAEQTEILANVANWAHGIGLLAGLVAGYFLTLIRK